MASKSGQPAKRSNRTPGTFPDPGRIRKAVDEHLTPGDRNSFGLGELEPAGQLPGIFGGGLIYTDGLQPVDPGDCARWPGSILCNGRIKPPLKPGIIRPVSFWSDGCLTYITLSFNFLGFGMPSQTIVFVDPDCRLPPLPPPSPPPPIPPGGELPPSPLPDIPDDCLVLALVGYQRKNYNYFSWRPFQIIGGYYGNLIYDGGTKTTQSMRTVKATGFSPGSTEFTSLGTTYNSDVDLTAAQFTVEEQAVTGDYPPGNYVDGFRGSASDWKNKSSSQSKFQDYAYAFTNGGKQHLIEIYGDDPNSSFVGPWPVLIYANWGFIKSRYLDLIRQSYTNYSYTDSYPAGDGMYMATTSRTTSGNRSIYTRQVSDDANLLDSLEVVSYIVNANILWCENDCAPLDNLPPIPSRNPPPPPSPPPLPPCDCMSCCESSNATLRLTREIHKSLRADMFGRGIAAKVPEGMVRPGKNGVIDLKDYVDVFEFLLRTIDRYLGKPPWSVFVEDTDPNTAGNQSLTFRFESIGEMLKNLLETEANKPVGSGTGGSASTTPESIVNIRTVFEVAVAILFEIGVTHKLVAEIRAEQQEQTEALGYKVNDKVERVNFAFSPLAKALGDATSGSEEELQRVIPRMLKPSSVNIKYSENEDEKTLYQLITEVNDLLKSIRGAFTSPVKSYKQFKGLMEGVEFGMDAAQLILLRQIRQALGNLPKNEFQDFMDNLEKRYTENQSPVASDQGKPFQQPVSNEPVIIVQEQKSSGGVS